MFLNSNRIGMHQRKKIYISLALKTPEIPTTVRRCRRVFSVRGQGSLDTLYNRKTGLDEAIEQHTIRKCQLSRMLSYFIALFFSFYGRGGRPVLIVSGSGTRQRICFRESNSGSVRYVTKNSHGFVPRNCKNSLRLRVYAT